MKEEKKDTMNITDAAISELWELLRDTDKKIRLRAISIILRHSDKTRRQVIDDEFSKELNSIVKCLEDDFYKTFRENK